MTSPSTRRWTNRGQERSVARIDVSIGNLLFPTDVRRQRSLPRVWPRKDLAWRSSIATRRHIMQSTRAAQIVNLVREHSLSITASDGYVLGATHFEPAIARGKLVIIN